jgi:hypothetical protein
MAMGETGEKGTRRDLDLPEVTEDKATEEVARVYQRIKETLQANVVNFVWRAFAAKPRFLEAAWDRLEPCVDRGFMEAAGGIRARAIERVRESQIIPDHRTLLGKDLHEAVQELRVFLEVNPRLLILTSAMRMSWKGADVGGHRQAVPTERAIPRWHPEISVKDGSVGKLKGVYSDIEETLDIPKPNTDFRALGKWPDYLAEAWNDLKPFIGSTAWKAVVKSVDWNGKLAAIALPEQVRISASDPSELGLEPDEVEEVGSWITAFDTLLPPLIVNTSWLWLGMTGGVAAIETEGHPAFEEAAG